MAHDGVSIRFVAKGLRQQSATVKGGRAFKFLFALSRRVFVNDYNLTGAVQLALCFYSLCREGSSSTVTVTATPATIARSFYSLCREGSSSTDVVFVTPSEEEKVSIRFVAKGLRQPRPSWPAWSPGTSFYSLCREGSSSTRRKLHNERLPSQCFYSLCREGSSSTKVFIIAASNTTGFYSLCREGSSSTDPPSVRPRGRAVSIRFVAKGLRQRLLRR